MAKFPVSKYPQLEINRAAFLKNGEVVSQLPLSADFTEENLCFNGMWVDANKANHEIKPAAEVTAMYGIVYTTEKEWNPQVLGLKHFAQKEGDYPRVGIMQRGDTFTTNCFDMGEFEDPDAIKLAINGDSENEPVPVYIIPVAGEAMPSLAKAAPAEGLYGQVIKYYTMPNGEPAIKYNIVRH